MVTGSAGRAGGCHPHVCLVPDIARAALLRRDRLGQFPDDVQQSLFFHGRGGQQDGGAVFGLCGRQHERADHSHVQRQEQPSDAHQSGGGVSEGGAGRDGSWRSALGPRLRSEPVGGGAAGHGRPDVPPDSGPLLYGCHVAGCPPADAGAGRNHRPVLARIFPCGRSALGGSGAGGAAVGESRPRPWSGLSANTRRLAAQRGSQQRQHHHRLPDAEQRVAGDEGAGDRLGRACGADFRGAFGGGDTEGQVNARDTGTGLNDRSQQQLDLAGRKPLQHDGRRCG